MWGQLWAWLTGQVWPNIFASGVCFVIGYFWKVRPHIKAQKAHREAEIVHRAHMRRQIEQLHAKQDELHQTVRDFGGAR